MRGRLRQLPGDRRSAPFGGSSLATRGAAIPRCQPIPRMSSAVSDGVRSTSGVRTQASARPGCDVMHRQTTTRPLLTRHVALA
jgi:hypothetical protein